MTGQILLCTGNARKIIRDLTNNEFVSFIVLLFSIRLVCLELVLFDPLPLRCYLHNLSISKMKEKSVLKNVYRQIV